MTSNRIGKYAWLELERRFLLREPPARLSDGWRITDRYISGTRLRLRRMEKLDGTGIIYKLGQKFRSETQSAAETTMTTMYLTSGEYDVLSRLEGRDLVKVRYTYPIDGREFGVDVFQGPLEGLVLADMEALTLESLSQFEPPDPDWLEVTEESFFTGGSLITLTRESFLAGMHRFNSQRLK